ncbi:MAG: XRE family transcriptional regulator [Paludibacteraceae bacterium]|nr:XRE family transcriptional regulator [Paludibacteraceae bacterium]
MQASKPHIGRIINDELHAQGHTTVWLAQQLNCTRRNVYKIYQRSWIQTDLLLRISVILRRDFFVVYSKEYERLTQF